MGLNIDWGKILTEMLAEFAKPLLKWALEKVYELAEQWADGLFKETGEKPAGEKKMAIAVSALTAMEPSIEPAEARALLEAHHLARRQSDGGRKPV